MTDKQASNIILLILLVVLVIICYQCESTQAAVGVYIIAIVLLCKAGRAAYNWLEK